jgi:hypothetical protein
VFHLAQFWNSSFHQQWYCNKKFRNK